MDQNRQIAELLREIADGREILGANPFRVRAYRQAAKALLQAEEPVSSLPDPTALPGVGKGIAALIAECLESGTIAAAEAMRDQVGPGVRELLSVQGIGPGTVGRLREAGVSGPSDLESRLAAGEDLGFRGGQAAAVAAGLEYYLRFKGRFLWPEGERAFKSLAAAHQGLDLRPAGALRRHDEVLDVVSALLVGGAEEGARLAAALDGEAEGGTVTGQWEGRAINATLAAPEGAGTAWIEATALPAHLEGLALAPAATEEEAYEAAGEPFWPPELRRWPRGEFPEGPPALVEVEDIQGDLHTHTDASDGTSTLAEMAAAAAKRGYDHLAITDHSPSAGYAGGLSPERLAAQGEEIRGGEWPLRLLAGTESDIRPDGTLDYPQEVLDGLDIVVGSIHQGLKGDQTERVLKALENPALSILGHATGRRLLLRDGYALDWGRVLPRLAEAGVALEINGNPERLDAEAAVARRAAQAGVEITLSTDAHHTNHLAFMRLAVAQARRAGLGPAQIRNTRPYNSRP